MPRPCCALPPALVFGAVFTILFLTGCATVDDLRNRRERPESLEPVAVPASPWGAYEAALTLAFDQGYQILYSNQETRLIELEALDRRLIRNDRVQRIDLFVRPEAGETRIHVRVHSYSVNDPGDIAVTDQDREDARLLTQRLLARLEGRPAPRSSEDAPR